MPEDTFMELSREWNASVELMKEVENFSMLLRIMIKHT